jgi:hypothetical protein
LPAVRISVGDLQAFAVTPAPLSAPVEPALTVCEEVVLLSLDASRGRVRDAVRVCASAHPEGPQDYHAAVHALQERGMLKREGTLRSLCASAEARIEERKRRILAVIHRAVAPVGSDAELLVLLAACRALQVPNRADHMRAHARVASIGQTGEVPAAVCVLCAHLGVASMTELADVLLPASIDLHDANFDPGMTGGIGM